MLSVVDRPTEAALYITATTARNQIPKQIDFGNSIVETDAVRNLENFLTAVII